MKSFVLFSVYLFAFAQLGVTETNIDENFEENDAEVELLFDSIYGVRKHSSQSHTRNAATSNRIWSHAIVPYTISSEFSSTSKQKIVNSFAQFHMNSCIRFVPWNRTIHESVLHIQLSGNGCISNVNKESKRQFISFDEEHCMDRKTILQKLMTTLGFEPESNRPDRDQYILINFENIIEEKKGLFRKRSSDVDQLGDYDYGSITHFTSREWNKNGQTTIAAKNSNVMNLGGDQLSTLDWQKVRKLYGCIKKNSNADVIEHLRHGYCTIKLNKAINIAKKAIRQGLDNVHIAMTLGNAFETNTSRRVQVIVTGADQMMHSFGNTSYMLRLSVYQREILLYRGANCESAPAMTGSVITPNTKSPTWAMSVDTCGSTFWIDDLTSFTFTSPGYPNNYPGSFNCRNQFHTTYRHRIRVVVSDMKTEFENDYLVLRDYGTPDNTIFANLSDEMSRVHTYFTNDNWLEIQFTTDRLVEYRGWKVILTTV